MAHDRYSVSRWPSMRGIHTFYSIHDFSPGVNKVLLKGVELLISISKGCSFGQSSRNWKRCTSWQAPVWEVHLKGLTPQIRASSATINSFSNKCVLIFKSNFPQGFNFHLVPFACLVMEVFSYILALREPVLTVIFL